MLTQALSPVPGAARGRGFEPQVGVSASTIVYGGIYNDDSTEKTRLREPELVEAGASGDLWTSGSCAMGPKKKEEKNRRVLADLV